MDRSMVRSRTSSTSSVRSDAAPSNPTPTPVLAIGGAGGRTRERGPSPDQLAASLSRLRAERALATPGAPATTPSPATPHPHSLHPDAILDSLSQLGGDEGIASCSLPSTPAPTPFSPSPSINQHITSDQIAASIQRLREEGVGSLTSTQPTTPSTTPAYPPNLGGQPVPGAHNLGVIPEHLAEGMNNIFRGAEHRGLDSGGLDSGSNPCTPTPTPFSPSPAQHSILAEQLAAGIFRLKVEEGMSSGGSTGLPCTPAPTPFSLGPGGIRPEDLVAGISRLSVIQEMDTVTTQVQATTQDSAPNVAISVHEASGNPSSSLSNYFGSPQSSGDSVFDTLATPARAARSRAVSESQGNFQDVTIGTPAKTSASQHRSGVQTQVLDTAGGVEPGDSSPHVSSLSPAPPQTSDLPPGSSPGSTPASPQLPNSLANTVSPSPNSPSIFTPSQLRPSPLPNRPESPARKSPTEEDAVLEAWLPSQATREALAALAATPGTYYPTKEQLTSPGVMPGSEQGDPVREAVAKYQGEGEAMKRQILTSDGVTSDVRGLQQLLAAGNYRAAVNHTASLLELYGQGKGRAGHLSKHSPTSLHIWCVRLSLLVRLRQFSVAEAEAAALGDLDRPDLYYQYYPDIYPGRKGSLAPWSLRLLLAELPVYCGKQVTAMNNLFQLLRTVRSLISNLESGLLPGGEPDLEGKVIDRAGAVVCWKEREKQVLHSLVNCSIMHQDYESAVKCLDMLRDTVQEQKDQGELAALHAAYGRLYLQLGNLTLAENHFTLADKARGEDRGSRVESIVDSAFLAIGQGQFQAALDRFLQAEAKLEDKDSKQALAINNNISVCLLYVGRLKEGLARLETSVTGNTSNIQANPILNLCTLYELESSYAMQKKIGMLGLVSLHCPDSFSVASLKL